MIIEEIRKRIGKKVNGGWDEKKHYIGFDMSGCRDEGGTEVCRRKNFKLLKDNFGDIFWDLEFEHFKLQAWKGTVWWGEDNVERPWDEDFSGKCSEDIILWLIRNKPYPKIEISRVISRQSRYDVLKRQKWNCNQCGCKLKFSKNNTWIGEVAHIDHIHPFTKKGSYPNGFWNINEPSNLQALCPDCNLKKGKKDVY
jgi:hypothetical protein